MAAHAKNALRCLRVTQVVNLSLAIPTPKASSAKGLFTGKDCKIFNLVIARAAAVGAVVAYKGTIAEKE
jgi:hypothetical protein